MSEFNLREHERKLLEECTPDDLRAPEWRKLLRERTRGELLAAVRAAEKSQEHEHQA